MATGTTEDTTEASEPASDGWTDPRDAEIARLTEIIEGRMTAPTIYETDEHGIRGGAWLVRFRDKPGRTAFRVGYGSESNAWRANRLVERWWPLDASGRPCAWPVPK